MKKLLFCLVLVFFVTLTTFAQRTENYTNEVIQPTYVRSLIRIGTSTYDYTESTSVSEIKIGLSTPNLYGCGFVVYDLASILGTNPNATSATLRVKLYNSAGQPPTLIYGIVTLDNGIINSSVSQQWQSIAQGSSTASQNYNQVLEYNIASLINSNSSSGKVTIGFRSDNIGQMYDAIQYAEITFTGTATVQEQISVLVKNNFDSGVIKARVDTPPTGTSNSPVSITDMTSKTLYMEAVEGINQSVFEYYARVFNDTEGPSNKSNWYKRDAQGNYLYDFSSNVSISITLSSSEKNYSYVADMKKLCNATFQNSGRSITANGTNGTSSVTVAVVEQNSVTVSTDNYYYSNGIDYTFSRWTKVGISYYSPFIVTEHGTYTAVYIGKPTNSGENVGFSGNVNQPIVVTWTDNPNTYVTQYQIWRRVKHNGIMGPQTLLSTVNSGVQSYTDYEYVMTDGYTDDFLSYDVRAYYSPDGTYSDPYYYVVYGKENYFSMLEDKPIASLSNELPSEYSIANYPNPFNPTTTINYQLPENGFVTIKVYDMLGKEVATLVNESKSAGYYNVNFDAGRLTSGIYICTITANNFIQSKKIMLIK